MMSAAVRDVSIHTICHTLFENPVGTRLNKLFKSDGPKNEPENDPDGFPLPPVLHPSSLHTVTNKGAIFRHQPLAAPQTGPPITTATANSQ